MARQRQRVARLPRRDDAFEADHRDDRRRIAEPLDRQLFQDFAEIHGNAADGDCRGGGPARWHDPRRTLKRQRLAAAQHRLGRRGEPAVRFVQDETGRETRRRGDLLARAHQNPAGIASRPGHSGKMTIPPARPAKQASSASMRSARWMKVMLPFGRTISSAKRTQSPRPASPSIAAAALAGLGDRLPARARERAGSP